MSFNEETYPPEDSSWLSYLWTNPAMSNLIKALRYEFGTKHFIEAFFIVLLVVCLAVSGFSMLIFNCLKNSKVEFISKRFAKFRRRRKSHFLKFDERRLLIRGKKFDKKTTDWCRLYCSSNVLILYISYSISHFVSEISGTQQIETCSKQFSKQCLFACMPKRFIW